MKTNGYLNFTCWGECIKKTLLFIFYLLITFTISLTVNGYIIDPPPGALFSLSSIPYNHTEYGASSIVSTEFLKEDGLGIRRKAMICHSNNKVNIPVLRGDAVYTTGYDELKISLSHTYSFNEKISVIYEKEIARGANIKLTFNSLFVTPSIEGDIISKLKQSIEKEYNESYSCESSVTTTINQSLRDDEYWRIELRKNFRITYYIVYQEVYNTYNNSIEYYVPISYEYMIFPIGSSVIIPVNFNCHGEPQNLPVVENNFYYIDSSFIP